MITKDKVTEIFCIIDEFDKNFESELKKNLLPVTDGKQLHIPADTRSAFPVISVQSPVSIQCCWQS